MSTIAHESAQRAPSFFVVGGTVSPDSPSYVERPADHELYERIHRGELCYVLTTRQVGKSSLMARTARRLADEGLHVAVVDLSVVVETGQEDAGQWYYGVMEGIVDSLDLDVTFKEWWAEQENLPLAKRLVRFLRDVVLDNTRKQIVIFFDEIDSMIPLSFSDDFFAAIRACYNERAVSPEYQRLSFALLGTASPLDLIKDRSRTPFNVGARIELSDFTMDEAAVLAEGLHKDSGVARQALTRILYWTGGHPYLTQKICQHFKDAPTGGEPEKLIDRYVRDNFLAPHANRTEDNLRFVIDRLAKDSGQVERVLVLYRRILAHRVAYDSLSEVHTRLKLSGLVKEEGGPAARLIVRNRIYSAVFSKEWVNSEIRLHHVNGTSGIFIAFLFIGSALLLVTILPIIGEEPVFSRIFGLVAGVVGLLSGLWYFYFRYAHRMFSRS